MNWTQPDQNRVIHQRNVPTRLCSHLEWVTARVRAPSGQTKQRVVADSLSRRPFGRRCVRTETPQVKTLPGWRNRFSAAITANLFDCVDSKHWNAKCGAEDRGGQSIGNASEQGAVLVRKRLQYRDSQFHSCHHGWQ